MTTGAPTQPRLTWQERMTPTGTRPSLMGAATDPLASVTEAMAHSGLDYTITKRPLQYRVGDKAFKSGKFALVREDQPDRPLGVVGPGYTPVQNADIARVLDPLAAEWPVVMCTELSGTVVVMLDAGETTIHGPDGGTDVIRDHFLLSDGKGNGRALHMAYTPQRFSCANQLVTGLRSAHVSIALFHGSGVVPALGRRTQVMRQLFATREAVQRDLQALALKRVTEAQVEQIIRAAYPANSNPRVLQLGNSATEAGFELDEDTRREVDDALRSHAYHADRIQAYRTGARDRYGVFCAEFPEFAGTAWGAWQAVTETEDYRRGSDDSLLSSVFFGERAKRKAAAFQAALRLSTVN